MKKQGHRDARLTLGLIFIFIPFLLVQSALSVPSAFAREPEQYPLGLSTLLSQLTTEIEQHGHRFSVGYNPAMEYSIEQLCSLVVPPDWDRAVPLARTQDASIQQAQIMLGDLGALPGSFDWRAYDGVTPVKSQGGCGSCWAFGTVAPLESAIKIHLGTTVDLSEQYLVSCNTDGWGCTGGWWAHDYHWWKIPPDENEAGGVYGAEFPYVAADSPCNGPHTHPFVIDSWEYVPGGGSWSVAPIEEIKQAIFTYGPVSAAVAVGSYFQAYRGGVFDRDEAYGNSDNINHAVTLIGWNDDYYGNGSNVGVWILKNSWSSGWGDNGYMYISYNTSMVGYGACYVVFEPAPPVDTDGDGLLDIDEVDFYGTDPLDADSDTDQMPDGWEVEYGLDPLDPSDAYGDLDGDGLTNLYEYQTGSDPSEPPPVGLGTYDDTNANIVYAGAWHNYRGSSPYNGTLHYSDVVGSTASLIFTGDGVTLVYTGYSNRGVMRIEIDGVEVASLDQYTSSTEWQQEWSSELLADGEHTLTLTHDSGQIVDVDAIIIGPPPPVGLGTYDDTNANIVYAGAWHNYSGSDPYNGTLHYSDVVGSTASLIFTGDGVTLVYTGYSNRGVMRIEIDGVEVASLDQYTSSTEWQQEWSSELLADGEHTLTLTHDSGQIVDVDAIIIGPPPPVGLGTYDDTNANIVYAGAWHNYSGSDPYNGTLHYSDVVGSTASLIFTGDGVTLVYTGYSNRGVMRIEIDGVEVASLDQYTSSTEWQQEWSSELLADGEHTLTLTHDSGHIVDVDAVIITGTS